VISCCTGIQCKSVFCPDTIHPAWLLVSAYSLQLSVYSVYSWFVKFAAPSWWIFSICMWFFCSACGGHPSIVKSSYCHNLITTKFYSRVNPYQAPLEMLSTTRIMVPCTRNLRWGSSVNPVEDCWDPESKLSFHSLGGVLKESNKHNQIPFIDRSLVLNRLDSLIVQVGCKGKLPTKTFSPRSVH
jgi:hypothetical protein